MPLSEPSARQPLHVRKYDVRGFLRDDGLFDIEARMNDQKCYDFHTQQRGQVVAGEFLHDMLIRLIMDNQMYIRAVEVASDSTPFKQCPLIIDRYQQLVGLRIAPGWTRKVKMAFGGIQGCTHLSELLMPMATVAIQTIFADEAKKRWAEITGNEAIDPDAAAKVPSRSVGGCHALDPKGPVVAQLWPDYAHKDGYA